MERGSGVLLHISSLPSKYGIGTMGKAAFDFADFLKKSGQKYWQILPLGPSAAGNSPYMTYSGCAGNPAYIDLDLLAEEGLIYPDEAEAVDWGDKSDRVDYAKVNEGRRILLKKAFARGAAERRKQLDDFIKENPWLDSYAKFMSLKETGNERDGYDEHCFIQFLFYRQWFALKQYVNSLGIKIIGDMPFYVPADSAEFTTEPEQFMLDKDGKPSFLGGCPPDYFSEDGQLWGNPVYDFNRMKADGYSWWIRRVAGASKLYDYIRFDHFRAFASFWAVPAGEKTAKSGHWEPGPGMELVGVLRSWFNDTKFIAEDLGIFGDDVVELLKESGLPGMKVLQFAFDDTHKSTHLPHHYNHNCVCYTGTHDNPTCVEWENAEDEAVLTFAREYMGISKDDDICTSLIRLGMESVADIFIAPIQDWLGLGAEARMNIPGTAEGNWEWRLEDGKLTDELSERILNMTEMYGR